MTQQWTATYSSISMIKILKIRLKYIIEYWKLFYPDTVGFKNAFGWTEYKSKLLQIKPAIVTFLIDANWAKQI